LLKGLAHAHGYFSGYALKIPQVQNKDLIRYVRNQQIRRLLRMKSIWK
jgi:hypothetical protein